MYRKGHCVFASHSAAHALVCTAHSKPPPPYSSSGRQFSSAEAGESGVATTHAWLGFGLGVRVRVSLTLTLTLTLTLS